MGITRDHYTREELMYNIMLYAGLPCAVHLINTGVLVDGRNVSIQFQGSSNVRSYLCKIDDSNFRTCEQ